MLGRLVAFVAHWASSVAGFNGWNCYRRALLAVTLSVLANMLLPPRDNALAGDAGVAGVCAVESSSFIEAGRNAARAVSREPMART